MVKLFEQRKNHGLNPQQGGYSDIRLWPFYMVFSGSILLLGPILGFVLSFIIVSIPSLLIVMKIAARQNSDHSKSKYYYKELNEIYSIAEAKIVDDSFEAEVLESAPKTIEQVEGSKSTTKLVLNRI